MGRVGVKCGVCHVRETLQYSADDVRNTGQHPISPIHSSHVSAFGAILSVSRVDIRRNIALPKMASTPSSSAHSRSATSTAQMVPGTPAVDRRQHGRHRSSVLRNLHGMASRHTSRCTSSSSDTMEQGEAPGKDAPNVDDVEPEPRPFPKVGDVVRYMGKWENEISLGEVRQYSSAQSTLLL